jgi:ribosomal protein S27E
MFGYERSEIEYDEPKIIHKKGIRPTYEPTYSGNGVQCPHCGRYTVVGAGYGNRFECTRCGRIFS